MEPPFLAKAREALRAAHLLLAESCVGSATNRSYYAVFNAARGALVAAGVSSAEQRWSHEAIQGGFSLLIHRRKIYPAHLGADLSWLRGVRDLADYGVEMVSSKIARDAVKRADRFVELVAQEITK